jgi:GxxExxY protein
VGEYRLDLLIEDAVIVEVKSVDRFESVYVAQVLTYLKATGKRVGLIINFNVPVLKDGVRRVVL